MSLQVVYRLLIAAISVIPWSAFLQIISAVQWQEILSRDSKLTGAQKKAAVVTVITSQWPAAARYAGLLNDLAWLWCVLKGLTLFPPPRYSQASTLFNLSARPTPPTPATVPFPAPPPRHNPLTHKPIQTKSSLFTPFQSLCLPRTRAAHGNRIGEQLGGSTFFFIKGQAFYLRHFISTLERWNAGTLERWNAGTLERWNAGTLERWNAGTLEG